MKNVLLIIDECLYCGNTFVVNYKSQRRKFCSRKCYYTDKIGKKLSEAWRKNIGYGLRGHTVSNCAKKNMRQAQQLRHSKRNCISKQQGYWGQLSKNKEKNNIRYKMNRRMSNFIWWALKGKKNGESWTNFVNYNIEELMLHLEKQFDCNMSWKNYGKYWHIDHIKPKSLFKYNDFTDNEFKEC